MKNFLRSIVLVAALCNAAPVLAAAIRIDVTSAAGADPLVSGYFELLREGSVTSVGAFEITTASGPFFFSGTPTVEEVSAFIYSPDTARWVAGSNSFYFQSLTSLPRPERTTSGFRDLRFAGGSLASLYNLALQGSFSVDRVLTECFNCAPVRELPVTLSYTVIPLPAAGWLLLTGVAFMARYRHSRRPSTP